MLLFGLAVAGQGLDAEGVHAEAATRLTAT
jgi:hypothetical protein